MDPKYSNIFWHQGVKVFEDGILKSQKGQIKVAHLENDITKAMLNLYEHCSPNVLKAFLHMIGIKQAPGAFGLKFQVADTQSFAASLSELCFASYQLLPDKIHHQHTQPYNPSPMHVSIARTPPSLLSQRPKVH